MNDMLITYQEETKAALVSRDQAQKQWRELNECVCQLLKDPGPESRLDSTLKDRLLCATASDR